MILVVASSLNNGAYIVRVIVEDKSQQCKVDQQGNPI